VAECIFWMSQVLLSRKFQIEEMSENEDTGYMQTIDYSLPTRMLDRKFRLNKAT